MRHLPWQALHADSICVAAMVHDVSRSPGVVTPDGRRRHHGMGGMSSMTRVLLIGIKPEAVDVSDPDLPPGTTPDKIAAGIEAALSDMKARGWEGAFCSILPDGSAEATIAASLAERWDCIVIGGGIRVPSRSLPLFERVINAVHRGAAGTPIAFNTTPNDTADAAARWLDEG